jgi:putative transposase
VTTLDIFINSLIEYRDKDLKMISIERVLWISDDLDTVIVIRIDEKEKSPLPQFKKYHEIIEILTTPFALMLDVDPYADLNSPNEGFLDKHKHIRDAKWDLIKEHVEYEPYIYDLQRLEEIVREIKNKTGKKSKRIYSVLREYWMGGKTNWASATKNSISSASSKLTIVFQYTLVLSMATWVHLCCLIQSINCNRNIVLVENV